MVITRAPWILQEEEKSTEISEKKLWHLVLKNTTSICAPKVHTYIDTYQQRQKGYRITVHTFCLCIGQIKYFQIDRHWGTSALLPWDMCLGRQEWITQWSKFLSGVVWQGLLYKPSCDEFTHWQKIITLTNLNYFLSLSSLSQELETEIKLYFLPIVQS